MSEAKSMGRPTIAEADTGQVFAESSAASEVEAVGEGMDERSSVRPVKDVVVTVRMTAADADTLASVQRELGATSAPDAIRESVRLVAGLMDSEHYQSKRAQRPSISVDPAQLEEIRDAIASVAKAYGERSREVHFIGHNWNQIAKVANSTGNVDVNALLSIERALVGIRKQMTADAERDAKALKVLAFLS